MTVFREHSTREAGLAVLLSSLLLCTVAARAEPRIDPAPNPPVNATAPTDDNRPTSNPPAPNENTAAETERTEVGSEESNVDKDSSSGSYYPYSAGTVGDDPAEPTSTSLPAEAGDSDSGPTDPWGDAADSDGDGYLSRAELTKAMPALSASFDAMDVDGDGKLTRAEFRTWHESRNARVITDDGGN